MTDQEIVQALRQCAKSDCSSCGMCPIFPDRECVEHLAAADASLIERLTAENAALREKVPQWISVEDRLPIDRLSKYLVAFRDAGGSIVDMARYFPSDGWTCDNWEVPQNLITHWMPLPEAPEEHNGKENP
jgi:hypothetical protein